MQALRKRGKGGFRQAATGFGTRLSCCNSSDTGYTSDSKLCLMENFHPVSILDSLLTEGSPVPGHCGHRAQG